MTTPVSPRWRPVHRSSYAAPPRPQPAWSASAAGPSGSGHARLSEPDAVAQASGPGLRRPASVGAAKGQERTGRWHVPRLAPELWPKKDKSATDEAAGWAHQPSIRRDPGESRPAHQGWLPESPHRQSVGLPPSLRAALTVTRSP